MLYFGIIIVGLVLAFIAVKHMAKGFKEIATRHVEMLDGIKMMNETLLELRDIIQKNIEDKKELKTIK